MQKSLRLGIIILANFGIAIFALLLSTTFADRSDIERAAVFAVQSKIKVEARERYPELGLDTFASTAERLRDRFGAEAEGWSKALDAKLDVLVAESVAKLCGCAESSESNRTLVNSFFKGKESRAVNLASGLQDFISGRYETIISSLVRDLRIFSAVNIAAFALVLLLAWIKPTARTHLLFPAGLLFVSVIVTICLYIFGQNWFYTLLLSSFWGFTYLIYMCVTFALMLDITLNKARIITAILNTVSSVSISPC